MHMLGQVFGRVDTKMMNVVLTICLADLIKINEWQSYTVEGTINMNSKSLSFGGLCLYNGKFYFDKMNYLLRTKKSINSSSNP
jgi:uncharacterized membrane protein